MASKQKIVDPFKEASTQAKASPKTLRQAANPKQSRVYNLKKAFQEIKDSIKQICECGCLESEHFLNSKLKPINCAECACPRFKTAFKLEKY